jgi:hypothetical protein
VLKRSKGGIKNFIFKNSEILKKKIIREIFITTHSLQFQKTVGIILIIAWFNTSLNNIKKIIFYKLKNTLEHKS